MGKGLSGAGVGILQGDIGQRRRKGDDSDSEQDAMDAFNAADRILAG